MANRCSSTDRFPVANVKAVLSCFSCGREGHVAKDCRRRLTYKGGVGETLTICVGVSVKTLSMEAVSVETPISQVEPKEWTGLGRETTERSCRATRRLPAGTNKWLSTVHN
jgi:hypothetical protein